MMFPRTLSLLRAGALLVAGLFTLAPEAANAQVACSNGDDGYTFSWQGKSWSGTPTTTNQWAIQRPGGGDPVTVSFAFSGNTNRFQPGYPAVTNLALGGFPSSTLSLLPLVDFNNTGESITMTVGFTTQVYNVSVNMFDIDIIAPSGGRGGFRDNIIYTGRNTTTGATNIRPTISTPYHALPTTTKSPSTVQLFASDTGRARGVTGDSPATDGIGNAVALFSAPITGFTWAYNNNGISTSNPAQQAVAIHTISFCVPRFADVDATKTVVVHRSDTVGCSTFPGTPEAGLPAAIPGSCVEYTIQATNTGAGIARGLDLSDTLNANHIFRGAQISGFLTSEPGYGFSTPTNGTNCSGSACVIALNNGRLNPGGTGTIRIRAEVK